MDKLEEAKKMGNKSSLNNENPSKVNWEPIKRPPQKPNTNPTRVWQGVLIIAICLAPICLILAGLVFQGYFYLQAVLACFCSGFAVATVDWMLEVYAYEKGLWYMYGGHTKLSRFNSYTIPIEMSVGFIFLGGIDFVCLSYLPLLVRQLGINLWPFNNPTLDLIVWVPIIILLISLGGAYMDFHSATNKGALLPGPNWTYWKHILAIYFPILTSGLVASRIVMIPWENPMFLLIAVVIIVIIVLVLLASLLLFHRFFIRKHLLKEN